MSTKIPRNMRKKNFIFFGAMVLVLLCANIVDAQVLKKGMRGEEVSVIQEVLKTDPAIYPEGLVTGYFGPLTESAVRVVQKRCGVEETGVVDTETEKCIFPVIKFIKVVSPNGEEIWDRSQIQTIKWEVNPWVEDQEPLWTQASIDLFRRVGLRPIPVPEEGPEVRAANSVFVKHIGFTDLYDGVYSWNIGSDVKNGSDYVIRISVGKSLISHWQEEFIPEEIWPPSGPPIPVPPVFPLIYWDESDGPFTIKGEVLPTPTCPDLQPVIALLKQAIASLNKALDMLYKIVE